jgi:hypothetical protein
MVKSRSVLKQRSEHVAGTYEVGIPAYIRSNPSSSCEESKIETDPGDTVILTSVTEAPSDEPGIVFAQTQGGGWIKLEQADGTPVVSLREPEKGPEASPTESTPLAGSVRRESRMPALDMGGGNRSSSPPPAKRTSSPGRSISPGGSTRPSMTAAQIAKERRQSASEKIELLQERRRSRSNSINSVNAAEGRNTSDSEGEVEAMAGRSASVTRRKSSISVVEDSEGRTRITDDSRAKLVGRLGEETYLTKKNEEIELKIDFLSVLMKRHVEYEKDLEKMKARNVRFGDA